MAKDSAFIHPVANPLFPIGIFIDPASMDSKDFLFSIVVMFNADRRCLQAVVDTQTYPIAIYQRLVCLQAWRPFGSTQFVDRQGMVIPFQEFQMFGRDGGKAALG